jgi:undecaprenyl-diphosphatase
VPWVGGIEYLNEHPKFNKTFDVALHLGTLLGVVAYFRQQLWELILGALSALRHRRVETPNERLATMIAIASVPAAVVGALLEDPIDTHLGDPWQIAILLAVFGLLLGYADRRPERRGMGGIGPRSALAIGVAQAVSLAPGVSRSGVTITAGRFLGLDRDSAARFSFLLLVPVTTGALMVKAVGVVQDGLPPGVVDSLVIGIAASAVTGYLAIAWMLRYVRTRNYDIFVAYRLVVAAAVGLIILTGLRDATF